MCFMLAAYKAVTLAAQQRYDMLNLPYEGIYKALMLSTPKGVPRS